MKVRSKNEQRAKVHRVWLGGIREEHRSKNRPKEKETPLLPALNTKSQKTEKRGG